jgi:hypothetical protein
MRERQKCVGCGGYSPQTETNYTLISAQYGWRLTRFQMPRGGAIAEWRCPDCWQRYKEARGVHPAQRRFA